MTEREQQEKYFDNIFKIYHEMIEEYKENIDLEAMESFNGMNGSVYVAGSSTCHYCGRNIGKGKYIYCSIYESIHGE